MRAFFVGLLSLIAISSSYAQDTGSSVIPEYQGFIRTVNGRFADANCQEFPVNGMNTWMLMEAAAGLAVVPCQFDQMNTVQWTFKTAAENGLTVVRVFAHGVNATLTLQSSPGVYNETAFQALDYILDEAAYQGVKVIFTLGDNWQYSDSKRNYNTWAGFDEDSDQFWTSNATRTMYKNHIDKMVNRINTYNGIRYRDDPTIFAWNLMNEPRCNCFPTELPYPPNFAALPAGCNPSCADTITAWVAEMSAYLKALDSNHLVTVGEEGFWGYYDPDHLYNPENSVSPWAALTGNNFTPQHNLSTIDFAAIHYWPDQWTPKATSDWEFFLGWMGNHSYLAQLMNKPLVLEELGTGVVANQTLQLLQQTVQAERLPFMDMVYSEYNKSLATDGNWRGTLFWMWGLCPMNTQRTALEVSAGDADFQAVISPTAEGAISKAISESPLLQCLTVEVQNVTINEIPTISETPSTVPVTDLPYRVPDTASTSVSFQSQTAAGRRLI